MTLPPPPASASRSGPSGTRGDPHAQASAAALDRYAARLRRPRIVYFAIVGAVVVGLVVFAAVAYSRGEVAHTTLHTVAHPPPSLGPATPDAAPQLRWHTGDTLAAGTPYAGGTVVTYSTHTVRGRDARTGRTTWSYTRTDRRVCNAVQLGATTISVYAVHGDCAEVTALDSGTGKRVWSRTLDEDGVTLNGTASYRWTVDTILIWSAGAMYAIDPSSGLDRWTYRRFGCTIEDATIGPAGALISQDCTHPRCKGVKYCGRGQQLVLRDGGASKADESKPNFDQFIWNDVGDSDIPLSAGAVVSALNRTTGEIDTVRPTDGRPLRSLALGSAPAPPTSTAQPTSTATGLDTAEGALVWTGGRAVAVRQNAVRTEWSVATQAAPTLTSDDDPPQLSGAVIVAPVAGGVAELSGTDGQVTRRFALPGLTGVGSGTRAYPLSTGFVVGTRSGTWDYR